MADNIAANSGDGLGAVIKTDDDGTAHWQYVKLAYGADNTQTRVTSSVGLPVDVIANSSDVDNTISTNNSTTSTLNAGIVYTGTADDVSAYAAVTVTLYASHASATDGMTFQFSTDSSNWDDTYSFTMAAGETRRFQFPTTAQYFRVRYTNGGTNQTAFRVQTILHAEPVGTSIHRLEDDVDPDRSATVTKSAIVAQVNGSGDFVPIQATNSGILKIGGSVDVDSVTGTVTVDNGGTFAVQATQAGTWTVDLGTTDNAVLDSIAAGYATEGSALGSGILLQGDDGTDRTNVAVTTTGHVETEVQNTVTITGTVTADAGTGVATSALQTTGNSILTTIDTDTGNIATDTSTIAGAVSGTEMQVDVVAALPAGTNNIGDVDIATITAGSNLIGDVGLSGARISGGTTLYKNIDVDETEDQIMATATQVYWIHAINLSSTVKYLKLYNNTAAVVTVGTTVPDLTFPIPTQGDTNGAGFTLAIPNGIEFDTALTIAATTGVLDNDSGAPGANEVIVNLGHG